MGLLWFVLVDAMLAAEMAVGKKKKKIMIMVIQGSLEPPRTAGSRGRRPARGAQPLGRKRFRAVLDLPKPKYCGAPNLCEDLY